jgi:hypothetical protein
LVVAGVGDKKLTSCSRAPAITAGRAGGEAMKKIALFGAAIALAVGVAATLPNDAEAKPAQKKAAPTAPAKLEKVPVHKPTLFKFGLSQAKVADVYDKVIDQDYLKRFQDAEPGIQMDRLEHEVRLKKEAFRRSFSALDAPPSGLDSTPFVGEFTYYNDEGFMRITRAGVPRTIFFIKDKAWKTIDVHKLGSSSKWGSDFEDAVKKIERRLGVEGRKTAGNPETGQKPEVDWTDGSLRFRLIDWGKDQLAISYVDVATESRLEELRTNKGPAQSDLDPEVKDALRTPKK